MTKDISICLLCFSIIVLQACDVITNRHDANRGNKNDDIASAILKDAPFLVLKLRINVLSNQQIIADLTMKNNLNDSILIFKEFFPFNNKMKKQLFSIYAAKTYKDIPPVKSDASVYPVNLSGAKKEDFFTIHPGETLNFTINLSDYYNFKEFSHGDEFLIAPVIESPVINSKYVQDYELDSSDHRRKPVFYKITLPYHSDLDSMRVKFKI